MRILFDECVPWPIRRILSQHVCISLRQCGWNGVKNGALLKLADGKFDLFLTSDKNLRYQQNLAGYRLAVLQLSTNNLRRLIAASALIQVTVAAMKPGEFKTFEIP